MEQMMGRPMIEKEVLEQLELLKCTVEPCGSRATCDPAPKDTDADFLVVIPQYDTELDAGLDFTSKKRPDKIADVEMLLTKAGYVWEGSAHYQDMIGNDFLSFRKDNTNLIVTASAVFAKRHRAATAVCKRLNLMQKTDRVAVFQAVLYANAA
jgi:hypothetical protein